MLLHLSNKITLDFLEFQYEIILSNELFKNAMD